MATVDELARYVLAAAATDANAIVAAAWINQRYKELTSRYKFKHLQESTSVDISGGGVTFDTGVTDIQFFARVRYFDGTDYQRDIARVTLEELDDWHPDRAVSGNSSTGPYVYADIGLNAGATQRKIEIYPGAQGNGSEALVFNYYEAPADLTISSSLPYGIQTHHLAEGVLIDLYRYEESRAIRMKDENSAMLWAKLAERQEARWERAMLLAYNADNGITDELRYPRT